MPMKQAIQKVLASLKDPKTQRALLDTGLVEGWSLDPGQQHLSVALKVPPEDLKFYESYRKDLETHLQQQFPSLQVFVALTVHRSSPPPPPPPSRQRAPSPSPSQAPFSLPQIKKVLAVASGKGGVGKSTLAFYMSLVLKKQGLRVGLLDLDIYGPSLPLLTGLSGPVETTQDKKIMPLFFQEMPVMSMGFLVPPSSPVIWRGPMIQSGVRQLFMDVDWPALDVLLVDLPPGTGDTQLTLAQRAPLTGVLIISTPQDLALADAHKGVVMFQKMKVPIWGLVENMAGYLCPHCGQESYPFLKGGAQEEALKHHIPFLGRLPLSEKLLRTAEPSPPAFLDDPQVPETQSFARIAQKILCHIEEN